MQQRYYDPAIGRFLSVDPVPTNPNNGANFSSYWYANNNPYRFTDPDGRAPGGACGGAKQPKCPAETKPSKAEGSKRVDDVIARNKIDTKGAEVVYKPGLAGVDGTIVGDSKIEVSPDAMESDTKLASVIEHEAEHIDQRLDKQDAGSNLSEAKAYLRNIRSAERIGNSPSERVGFLKMFHIKYDGLSEEEKKQVVDPSEAP